MAEYKYDVVNEAVLEATPAEIIAAYADEFAGRSSWGLPYTQARVRHEAEWPAVGAVIDVTVNGRPGGGVDRRDATRLTMRVTAYEPEQRVHQAMEGRFRGETEITLTPVDETHTRIREHWRANPVGPWRLVMPFFDVEAMHSTVEQASFKALGEYIAGKRARSG
jgi:hypothetical protein